MKMLEAMPSQRRRTSLDTSARRSSSALAIINAPSLRASGDDILLEFGADLVVENLAPSTIQAYLHGLFALSRYLRKPLESATGEDLQAYLRETVAQGLSVGTRSLHLVAIKRFFDWLRRTRHLPGSIAQDLRPIKRTKSLHRWWTAEQVEQFRSAFQDDVPIATHSGYVRKTLRKSFHLAPPQVILARDLAACELGLQGLRVNEVTGLCLEHVMDVEDPERAAILVHRKGRREGVLPLVADARAALQQWLRVRPNGVPSPYVFTRVPFQHGRPGRNPGRLHYASLERIVKAYATKAGLLLPRRAAFHHLRHSFGQQLAELGYGIEEAQAFLGHESPKTTMVYYEVSNARLRDGSRRFSYDRKERAK